MSEDGVRKSAILLMSIGEEEAVEVFKYLSPREVQRLGAAMAALEAVPREQVEAVLRDFREKAGVSTTIGMNADNYVRSVLNKALGTELASGVIDRILKSGDNVGLEALKWMDGKSIAEMIKNEHPQIIATIVVHLERDAAAEVLTHFTERLRNDVMLRVAALEGVQPSALRELNDVLIGLLHGTDKMQKSALGGATVAAEILNNLGTSLEASVMASLREHDAELAQAIEDQMFVFENLIDLDDRAVQLLLREVQSESLIVALKGTSTELREKIFKNMSARAAEMLRDDFESKGPVKLSEVEAEQREILKVIRRLSDEGQISIGGKADEGMVT
ncbi:MAG: flagellar motor switch protein FliG [Pseudomonadota bacterium]